MARWTPGMARAAPEDDRLRRLLAPSRIAVVGGDDAERAVLASRAIGFQGEIWPVHPRRATLGGVACFPDVASLPGPPDAAFVSVSRERTVEVVRELAALGAGGVVCHASGFAEDGPYGARLQADLVAAAGPMPLIGPNCLGVLNYLDGAALWPEQHGGAPVASGVGIISQSGNIGQNLTMTRGGLPLAQLVTLGNGAGTDVPAVLAAMVADDRITAVGLYLESLPDAAALARVAQLARQRRVPVVVLKAGSSKRGAEVTLSHTSSLAGSDALCDALFARLGFARVHELSTLVETLTLLHVHGALPGTRVASASCSGGEAAHVADVAAVEGVELPTLPADVAADLRSVLGERVAVRNPLDYHTYVWDDREALTATFAGLLRSGCDLHLLVLDLPRPDRCEPASWQTTLDAFVAAAHATGARAAVVSSLPEGLPEPTAGWLVERGVAPLRGVGDALRAVAAAAAVGAAQASADEPPFPPAPAAVAPVQLDEAQAKEVLAAAGVAVPASRVVASEDVEAAAHAVGYPVVVKALSATLAHKTDVGGVAVGLRNAAELAEAVTRMAVLSDRFLVEATVTGTVAELLVAVRRDPTVGLVLTLGAGGVLVDVLDDTTSLLLPASPAQVRRALEGLRVWRLLTGLRGRSADVDAVVAAVLAIARCARDLGDGLTELEVNPLLAGPEDAVAVDALLRAAAPVEALVGEAVS